MSWRAGYHPLLCTAEGQGEASEGAAPVVLVIFEVCASRSRPLHFSLLHGTA